MSDGFLGLTAAILCGGLGTRLRSVVRDRSKVMAEVGGRPFLSRLLDDLVAAGGHRVILCTGHQAASVQATLGASYGPLSLEYSQEETPLGTGGALAQASRLVDGELLAMNGDSYCGADLRALSAQHRASGALATLAVCQVADATAFGRVTLDPCDRVLGFAEKGAGGPGWVNAGIYIVPSDWLRAVPTDRPVSLERELFPAWLPRGVGAVRIAGPLVDIGTPESYAAARQAASAH